MNSDAKRKNEAFEIMQTYLAATSMSESMAKYACIMAFLEILTNEGQSTGEENWEVSPMKCAILHGKLTVTEAMFFIEIVKRNVVTYTGKDVIEE